MKRLGLWAGLALVGAVTVTAVIAWFWTPYSPTYVDPTAPLQGPTAEHWLGTDRFGGDVASRLMSGARVCLMVGVIAVAIAAIIGVPLGIIAGMARGWVGQLLVRATDVMYAFPALLLAILLAAALGGSTAIVMVAIGLASVPAFIRVARAATLPVMASDFVVAARASGTGWAATAWRHVLPNIAPVVGVQASVTFGLAILAEAGLSYLGIGVPVETPTWGRMLLDARTVMASHPAQTLWPGAAIALAVLGFNLLGDGLRDYLDPRLKEVR